MYLYIYMYVCIYIYIFNKNDINMYFLHLLAFMFAKHWNIPVFCQQRLENCVNNDVVVICHCCIQCKNNIFKNMFLAMVKPILQNYIKRITMCFLHLEIGCTIQQKKKLIKCSLKTPLTIHCISLKDLS